MKIILSKAVGFTRMMRLLICVLVFFSAWSPATAGWFGPSTVEECRNKHQNDIVYLNAVTAVNRSCWALYSSNEEIRSRITNPITDKTINELRVASKCFLKKSSSKELVSKESAARAAASCTDSREAFRFLTWSFSE